MLSLTRQLTALALSFSLVSTVFASSKNDEARAKFAKLAAAGNGVIKLDSEEFAAITASDRDWSVVVQLTALGNEFKCAPCHSFDPNFRSVAKAWTSVSKTTREGHFFASLDFADGQSVFRSLGINSAPVVNFYPAQVGPLKPANGKTDTWSYDFNRHLFDANTLAEVLSASTPTKIPYRPPPNYGLIFTAAGAVVTLLILARFFWMFFSSFFLSRWTWAFGCIITMLIFTSGHMFTRIRSMPFAQNTRGGAQWIASGYQNQFGAETYVVATLYGTLALSQIALIVLVPRILKPAQQRTAIYIWTGVTLLLYSVLLSLFKIKNAGYPFRLLF